MVTAIIRQFHEGCAAIETPYYPIDFQFLFSAFLLRPSLNPILKIPFSIHDDVLVTRIAEILLDALPLASADDLHFSFRVWPSKNHIASSAISRSHTVPTDHDLVRLLQRCACLIPQAVEKELPLVPKRCTVKELLVSTGKNQTGESAPARIDVPGKIR